PYLRDYLEGILNPSQGSLSKVSLHGMFVHAKGNSIVEIRQKVEKLSLMSEFVKIKAYISKKPTIYEEYSTPPVDYRNNTAIIRFPIDKKYQFYQFQYSVKGPFKEPEVIQIK
ncbi:hypothetical protein, partial [Thermocrinis sp.]